MFILYFLLLSQVNTKQYLERPTVKLDNLNYHKRSTEKNVFKLSWGSCYGLDDAKNDIFGVISGLKSKNIT